MQILPVWIIVVAVCVPVYSVQLEEIPFCVKFPLLTSAIKIIVLEIVVCSLVEINRCFRGAYCLHHQDDEQEEVSSPW
jgi:hypothetical protein